MRLRFSALVPPNLPVIPAKAGNQLGHGRSGTKLDPRFRGDDAQEQGRGD